MMKTTTQDVHTTTTTKPDGSVVSHHYEAIKVTTSTPFEGDGAGETGSTLPPPPPPPPTPQAKAKVLAELGATPKNAPKPKKTKDTKFMDAIGEVSIAIQIRVVAAAATVVTVALSSVAIVVVAASRVGRGIVVLACGRVDGFAGISPHHDICITKKSDSLGCGHIVGNLGVAVEVHDMLRDLSVVSLAGLDSLVGDVTAGALEALQDDDVEAGS